MLLFATGRTEVQKGVREHDSAGNVKLHYDISPMLVCLFGEEGADPPREQEIGEARPLEIISKLLCPFPHL